MRHAARLALNRLKLTYAEINKIFYANGHIDYPREKSDISTQVNFRGEGKKCIT